MKVWRKKVEASACFELPVLTYEVFQQFFIAFCLDFVYQTILKRVKRHCKQINQYVLQRPVVKQMVRDCHKNNVPDIYPGRILPDEDKSL